MNKKIACIILAAGKGTRMKSALPKPLHPLAGQPMVRHVIEAAEKLDPDKIVVVIGPDMPEMAEAVKPYPTAVQHVANGTGGAALAAREHFRDFDGDILVIFGDAPLIRPETLQRMVDIRRQLPAAGLAFSAMRLQDPARYGRMVQDDDGTLRKIVEYKDATEAERAITLCNGGVVCADGGKLFDWLALVGNDNAQGEYYLTDLPQIARKDNRTAQIVEVAAGEMQGANTRAEMAVLERAIQDRLREAHMLAGVTLTDPSSVFFCTDTVIAQDVTIGPNVVFGRGVTVDGNVEILPFSHIDGAHIHANAIIGPFARIRPGSVIGENVHIGNFVETKNASIGRGVKACHLSYLGDADVGENSNIGAGTITCNYDGFMKHRTTIGRESFIGSNSALVAPVTIGNGAVVAAGSTIGQDVPDNALGITRAPQINKEGWVPAYRQKKMKEKAKKG
jgi:bifunctional UDP-N-acetylglucosamine pyrophosphorylase/glucosamine-1-phosphate N-acetyltransferase